jgi:hypothetical protein
MRWCTFRSAAVGSLTICACLFASTVASDASTGRAYELVSPLYKGGFGAGRIDAVAPNGEGVMFYSPGAFEGTPAGFANLDAFSYFSHRRSTGWETSPELPPDTLLPYAAYRDVSSSLEETVALGKPGPNSEAALQEGAQEEFRVHNTVSEDIDSNWLLAGVALKTEPIEPFTLIYDGADGNLCHLLFESFDATPGPLLKEAYGTRGQLYEVVRGCEGEKPALRLVALNSEDKPISPGCIVDPGIGEYEADHAPSEFNAVADGGHEMFFTTCTGGGPSQYQLFARLDGARTLEISKPISECTTEKREEVPCFPAAGTRAPANFVGASEDGSRVFFTSTGELTSEDNRADNELYMAQIGCPGGGTCAISARAVVALTAVGHDPNGSEAANVQGVLRVAPDGSRVYFVARGDLLSEAAQDALHAAGHAIPVSGADNLYVYDAVSRQTEFVGELCTGRETSGAVGDTSCPGSGSDELLWLEGGSEVQTAGDGGEFLVFTSIAQLTSDDTDTAADVYRFDALTDSLVRVSGGEDGEDADGNNNAFSASILKGERGGSVVAQYEMNSRAISEDGSRIVFETAEPLSPLATNGLVNAYEWHEESGGSGSVSLLSGGDGSTPVEDVVMAPSGRDVFFLTTEGLVPQDTDGLPDVYDARLGGGFEQKPTSEAPCSEEACKGPLSTPAPLLVPGTAVQSPEAQSAPTTSVSSPPKKKIVKAKKKKTTKKRGKARAKKTSSRRGSRERQLKDTQAHMRESRG